MQDTYTPVSVRGTSSSPLSAQGTSNVTSTVVSTRIGEGHLHSCIGALHLHSSIVEGYLQCPHINGRLKENRCRTAPVQYRCIAPTLQYRLREPPMSHQRSSPRESVQYTCKKERKPQPTPAICPRTLHVGQSQNQSDVRTGCHWWSWARNSRMFIDNVLDMSPRRSCVVCVARERDYSTVSTSSSTVTYSVADLCCFCGRDWAVDSLSGASGTSFLERVSSIAFALIWSWTNSAAVRQFQRHRHSFGLSLH